VNALLQNFVTVLSESINPRALFNVFECFIAVNGFLHQIYKLKYPPHYAGIVPKPIMLFNMLAYLTQA